MPPPAARTKRRKARPGDEEQGDILVALEMLRLQRQAHEVDRARRVAGSNGSCVL